MVIRAKAVKGELSDVEGLGYKLEERQKNFLELKKTLRLKVGINRNNKPCRMLFVRARKRTRETVRRECIHMYVHEFSWKQYGGALNN